MNSRATIALAGFLLLVAAVVAGFYEGPEHTRVAPGTARATAVVSAAPAPSRRPAPTDIPELFPEKLNEKTVIAIDGKLDELAWQRASRAALVDVGTGESNRNFPVNGNVRVLWNDTGFFIGFEVSDPDVAGGFPKDAKDPHLWTRDTIEIMVDPDGDGDDADYYEIQIGPQNLIFDSAFDRYNEPRQEPDGPFGHEEWTSGVTSAVIVNGTLDEHGDRDDGYVVEALLPWRAFTKAKRAPPAIGDIWRLNFYAMQDNGGVAWSPILNAGNFHEGSRFGRVVWTDRNGPRPLRDRSPFQGGVPLRKPPERLRAPILEPPEGHRFERRSPTPAPR